MGRLTQRNLTHTWEANATQLVLDIDVLALADVQCGNPVEWLSFLGPGQPGIMVGEILFLAYGLTLDTEGDVLRGIHVHVRPTPGEQLCGVRPYRGAVRHGGAVLDPNLLDTMTAVARFGVPEVETDGAGRRVLTYLTDGTEWELVFGTDDRLEGISVY